jgi:hypothetical protein
MWKTLISDLSDKDAAQLAASFNFSGGQIENIARKSKVSFILNGKAPNLPILETFCNEELLEKAEVRIGFVT